LLYIVRLSFHSNKLDLISWSFFSSSWLLIMEVRAKGFGGVFSFGSEMWSSFVGCLCLSTGARELASSFRRFLVLILFVTLLQWLEIKTRCESVAGIPNNLLAMSLICRGTSCFAFAVEATKVVDLQRGESGGLGLSDRGRAHQRWSTRWSYGACTRRRQPAVAALLLHLQAEGRPTLFLLAKMPKGRQFNNVRSVAMVACYGSLVAPSGTVPGDGEVDPERKLRTRSRFFILVQGPFCKVQGLACNFQSLVCLAVKCAMFTVYE
jgi:hypothetical protein